VGRRVIPKLKLQMASQQFRQLQPGSTNWPSAHALTELPAPCMPAPVPSATSRKWPARPMASTRATPQGAASFQRRLGDAANPRPAAGTRQRGGTPRHFDNQRCYERRLANKDAPGIRTAIPKIPQCSNSKRRANWKVKPNECTNGTSECLHCRCTGAGIPALNTCWGSK